MNMQLRFEVLFLIGNFGNISKGKKFLRENSTCCISGTEGCRKLNFGEVSLQICQIFLRKKTTKKISSRNALLR